MEINKLTNELYEGAQALGRKKPVVEAEEEAGELNAAEIGDSELSALGDGLVAALSRVEMMTGKKFDRASDAWKYVQTALMKMKRVGKSIMMPKLRMFDRVGAERTAKRYRRQLVAKE